MSLFSLDLRVCYSLLCLVGVIGVLVSCVTTNGSDLSSNCVIALPESATSDLEGDILIAKRSQLEAFANQGISDTMNTSFRAHVVDVYKDIPDDDVACALLLRTVACMADKNDGRTHVSEFIQYLTHTKSCTRRPDAVISVDNIVQYMPPGPYLSTRPPVAFDLFVRNSGDAPAFITSIIVKFDEHLRPSRSPAGMQAVTGVYSITVDRNGAAVKGAELDSPARAFYPNPGSPVFIVESPVSQSLSARSTDRFRVKVTFFDSVEIRGPLDRVRVDVKFNNGQSVSSRSIDLEKPECISLKFVDEGVVSFRPYCNMSGGIKKAIESLYKKQIVEDMWYD